VLLFGKSLLLFKGVCGTQRQRWSRILNHIWLNCGSNKMFMMYLSYHRRRRAVLCKAGVETTNSLISRSCGAATSQSSRPYHFTCHSQLFYQWCLESRWKRQTVWDTRQWSERIPDLYNLLQQLGNINDSVWPCIVIETNAWGSWMEIWLDSLLPTIHNHQTFWLTESRGNACHCFI